MRSLIAWCVLAATPVSSFAVPVTYDFTVNGGAAGPVAGVTASGFFTFDDGIIPAGGTGSSGFLAPLFSEFSLTWSGTNYIESDVEGSLNFLSGVLTTFQFGSNCNASTCSFSAPDFLFGSGPSGGPSDFGFLYVLPQGSFNVGSGSATLRATSVPEPGTLALLAMGLAGVGVMRRRRTDPFTARNCMS